MFVARTLLAVSLARAAQGEQVAQEPSWSLVRSTIDMGRLLRRSLFRRSTCHQLCRAVLHALHRHRLIQANHPAHQGLSHTVAPPLAPVTRRHCSRPSMPSARVGGHLSFGCNGVITCLGKRTRADARCRLRGRECLAHALRTGQCSCADDDADSGLTGVTEPGGSAAQLAAGVDAGSTAGEDVNVPGQGSARAASRCATSVRHL